LQEPEENHIFTAKQSVCERRQQTRETSTMAYQRKY